MATSRREFLTTASIVLAGGALGRAGLLTQQPQSPPTPSFTDLRGNVGIFTARGGFFAGAPIPCGMVWLASVAGFGA